MLMKAIVFAVGGAAMAAGCADPESDANDTQEIVENLRQAGHPGDDITVVNGVVHVGGDAEVTLTASREMLDTGGSSQEQYRSANLVGGPNPSTICVNGAAFTGVFSTGMNLALANYNALALRLRFRRVAGGAVAGCTFFINAMLQAGTGGSSGFPSGGAPFGQIRIGSGLAAFSVDVIEHVITHELGHAIGLAHSDVAVPNACGGPGPGLGAIHIFGTPTGFTPSVMNCGFDASSTGELSPTDITALNILY
jgi:Dual-action HEIGH metallo-peptidase